jgi:hypothetical protein
MKKMILMSALLAVSVVAQAKLPAPVLTDEAKAKAAEAKAKAAHAGKVEGYKLCLSMDRAAANHRKSVANAKPATATPACADPGAFVAPVAAAAPAKP